jgi:hypothetical protein
VIDSGIAYRHEALGAGYGPAAREWWAALTSRRTTPTRMTTVRRAITARMWRALWAARALAGPGGARGGVLSPSRVFDDQGTTRPEWIESALESGERTIGRRSPGRSPRSTCRSEPWCQRGTVLAVGAWRTTCDACEKKASSWRSRLAIASPRSRLWASAIRLPANG